YFSGEGNERKPVRTIGVTLDVTEAKQSEEIIKNALKRLALEKNKLEESNRDLERFAAIAAHDLRAPIRSVGLWIEMIEVLVPKPWSSELEQAIHFTKANSKKSISLIQDLLEIAKVKPESSGWESFSLNQMVDRILLTLKTDVDASKAQITVAPLPRVEGIVWQFESVLSNLLRNALLYRASSRTPEISISFKEMPGFYLFQVRDNGIGIAPEYQKKIFEMFERLHTEEEFPGTGIGLALCKKLVESWGGEMCVESKLGIGSSFYFTYPKREAVLPRRIA
ncbi:MAG: sensor histidine kinase, partial [Deltaproteobacteria bacterium]